MNWFKKKTSNQLFDIGPPYYNLELIITQLRPYDEIDSFMALKNDILINLEGKSYSLNQFISYSIIQNIFPNELSITRKGYFINQRFDDLPTRKARIDFTEPTNIDALIDWNKLFKFINKPEINDEDNLINQAVNHLNYLMKGNFEEWTLHAHYISNGDIITFEIDTQNDNKIRVQETYESSLNQEEYEKRFMQRAKIKEKLVKKYFKA